ncbi:MAG: hypothetical protein R3244_12250 [Thermoanaerobaculia bacterium]|nr:hypothetical protein [Thermoanaerobaculia bacterium]
MRRKRSSLPTFTIAVVLALASSLPLLADDQIDIDIAPFYFGVSDYYQAPRDEVLALRGHLGAEEVPVVFHIATRADVRPREIVELHAAGHSWMEISRRYGVGPEAYYVPFERDPGPPYGKAWGYYRNKPRKDWRNIRLSDREIVDLVNLRFLSDHYGVDRHRVIEMRAEGHDHVAIARSHWRDHQQHAERPGARQPGHGVDRGSGRPEEGGHPGKGRGRAEKKKDDTPPLF